MSTLPPRPSVTTRTAAQAAYSQAAADEAASAALRERVEELGDLRSLAGLAAAIAFLRMPEGLQRDCLRAAMRIAGGRVRLDDQCDSYRGSYYPTNRMWVLTEGAPDAATPRQAVGGTQSV